MQQARPQQQPVCLHLSLCTVGLCPAQQCCLQVGPLCLSWLFAWAPCLLSPVTATSSAHSSVQLGPGCPLATLSFHRALLILGLAHHVPVGWGWTGSTGPAACPCDSPTPLGCFGAAKAFQLGNQGRKCNPCGETAETVHPGTGLTCCCADIPW